ncbi:DUF805 domain-containing protein [Phenylobacterium sp.]|uniref:DUF805 domain-containing protein n=1 Tax=Phenylobacterium sp. TaxID=1871053 RepID=UPI00271F5FD0|nr:DUF805 domain-containing protein [Phenylobacterium sp.]MDO8801382.1 DUF805 domain-containing protein [Phenylobacterium sp.]
MRIVKLFLWPRGRIGRLSFWRALLVLLLAAFAADLANYMAGWIHPLQMRFGLALFCLFCWLCLSAKRLEDAGRSRFLAAIPAAVLIVGLASVGFLVGALDGRGPAPWTMLGFFGPLAGIVVFLAATLWIGLAKSRG